MTSMLAVSDWQRTTMAIAGARIVGSDNEARRP
jgi:hypothetical protein